MSRVRVIDESGSVIAESYGLHGAKAELERYEKQKHDREVQKAYLERVAELQRSKEVLDNLGRNTSELDRVIYKAKDAISALFSLWYRTGNPGTVEQLIAKGKKEVERLSGDGEELLLKDILEGRAYHPDHAENLKIIAQLEALEIQSGGYIESISKDQLERIYRERLAGLDRLNQAHSVTLMIKLEDYAPTELLKDPQLELAPEAIEATSNKGITSYPIRYFYSELEGERIPVGMISVPLKSYKSTNFPKLPHGIRLILAVTKQGQIIAQGEDNEELVAKIKKYEKKPPVGKFQAPVLEAGLGFGYIDHRF